MKFEGFPRQALDWLNGIRLHNSREWFQENREEYEHFVRKPFTALLDQLSKEFGGNPKIFRPNRDVRFSANKRPYKTNISGYLAGKSTYYLDLSAERLMAATGYYQMAKDQLERYRATLSTDRAALTRGAELREIIDQLADQGLVVEGDALKTSPRGIAHDDPNVDLLRRKSLTISAILPSEDLGEPAKVIGHARTLWSSGEGLNAWLDAHVGPSTLEW